MSGSNSSKKNEGTSKKKPGPKVGSKRDPHANRPGPKRLMDQPNLHQQRLDKMTLFQSTSSSSNTLQEDQQVSPFNIIGSEEVIHTYPSLWYILIFIISRALVLCVTP
jgi:hypothetical protein